MNESMITAAQKINTVLWIAILSGMVMLFATILVLDNLAVIPLNPEIGATRDMLFYVAIALAFVQIYLKRKLLSPQQYSETGAALSPEQRLFSMITRIRRNYLLIWAFSEAIFMMGFIVYILSGDFSTIWIFVLVGFYAVLITKPQLSLLETCSGMLSGQNE